MFVANLKFIGIIFALPLPQEIYKSDTSAWNVNLKRGIRLW